MSKAGQGDTVTVEYTGKLDDGTVFDTSEDRGPISFTIGEDEVIPGFQEAVVGMEAGETASATLAPEDAYGPRSDERVFSVPRAELPEDLDPEVGDRLEVQSREGQTFPAVIAEVQDDAVTIDANHPLAGEELTFEIELKSID